jgi:thiol-disulfide isomerase/thioredoxin
VRKCVSMVAVASAAVGLTGCSGPDRTREPAGAAHPLSTASSAGGHGAQDRGQGHDHDQAAVPPLTIAGGAPAPTAPAATDPHAPAESLNLPAQPSPGAADPAAGAEGTPGASGAPAIGAPLLPPSGTTPFLSHPVAPQAVGDGNHLPVPDHAAAAKNPSAKNQVPPPALPAPPPPHPHASTPRPSFANVPGLSNLPYDSRSPALVQLVNAFAAAQFDGKPVLLDFGADWCPACKAVDKAMQTPKARAVLAQSYHVVHIDLGNGDYGNMMLASFYDAYGTYGMPLLIVLSPDGAVRVDTARSGQPKYDEASFSAWLKRWVR